MAGETVLVELDAFEFLLLATAASVGMSAANGAISQEQYERNVQKFHAAMGAYPNSIEVWNQLMDRMVKGARLAFPREAGDFSTYEATQSSKQFPMKVQGGIA